jgi:hypothetical protein
MTKEAVTGLKPALERSIVEVSSNTIVSTIVSSIIADGACCALYHRFEFINSEEKINLR